MRKPDESKKIRNLTRRSSIKTTGWKKKNAIPRLQSAIALLRFSTGAWNCLAVVWFVDTKKLHEKQRLRRATYGKNRNSFLFTTRYNNKLVAVGVNDEGYCKIIGVAEGSSEDKESRSNFLRYLKERGLNWVRLIVSDKCLGLYEIIGDFFPEAKWQRCIVHWYRNAFTMCPWKHLREVVAMLKAIHAQEDKAAARQKTALVAEKLRSKTTISCVFPSRFPS